MKKIIFSCILLFIIAYSFFFPEITVNAAQNGIQIWFHQILPALLPFTIFSTILVKSDFLKSFKGNATLLTSLLTMTCGFIFGFPVGAKLSADFYKQNLLSEKQAVVLSIATNNFSPMYVRGFALPLLFDSNKYNIATYFLLYITPLLIATAFLLQTFGKKSCNQKNTTSEFRLDMQIMDASILYGFDSLIKICGYIVLFSIVTEILITALTFLVNQSPFILTLFLGNLEITNGLRLLSQDICSEHIQYIAAIQLLSFGGLSGIAQTGSILSDAGLSVHKYIIGKASLSLLLTLLVVIYVFFIHPL